MTTYMKWMISKYWTAYNRLQQQPMDSGVLEDNRFIHHETLQGILV